MYIYIMTLIGEENRAYNTVGFIFFSEILGQFHNDYL